jgi:hypothetical protein
MVEMQSCKSRRDLQLLYKTYLHLSLYEIVMIFQNIMYIGELPHILWSLEKNRLMKRYRHFIQQSGANFIKNC